MSITGWLDWAFRSRVTGRITIAQAPNLPLWIFGAASIAASIAAWLTPAGGSAATALRWLALSSLFVWALDELLRGVNPFRRALGAGTLLYLAWTVLP